MRLHRMVFRKVESKRGNIAAFSKNTSQEKGKAVSHAPMTRAYGYPTLSPFEKPYSVYS